MRINLDSSWIALFVTCLSVACRAVQTVGGDAGSGDGGAAVDAGALGDAGDAADSGASADGGELADAGTLAACALKVNLTVPDAGSSNPSVASVNVPRIASNATGQAVNVWMQDIGANRELASRSFATDGGWSGPELLSRDNRDVVAHRVGIDSSGNAVTVWAPALRGCADAGAFGGMCGFLARRPAGGAWSANARIDLTDDPGLSPRTSGVGLLDVSVASNGSVVALFSGSEAVPNFGFISRVYRATATTAGSWTTSMTAIDDNQTIGGGASDGFLARDVGSTRAVFRQVVNNQYRAYADGPLNIDAPVGEATQGPQVGMDDGGNAIAVWTYRDCDGGCQGSATQISARRFKGAVLEAISRVSSFTIVVDGGVANTGPQDPQIAVLPSGHAVVVWFQSVVGQDNEIAASRYVPGVGWDVAASIGGPVAPGTIPRLRATAGGTFTAAWFEMAAPGFQNLVMRQRTATQDWGTKATLVVDGESSERIVEFDVGVADVNSSPVTYVVYSAGLSPSNADRIYGLTCP